MRLSKIASIVNIKKKKSMAFKWGEEWYPPTSIA